jgi:hypothetical protein
VSDDLVQRLREQAKSEAVPNEDYAFERLESKAADRIEDLEQYVRRCKSQCDAALSSLGEHRKRLEVLEKQVYDVSYMLTSECLRSKKLEAELKLLVETIYAVVGPDLERASRALEGKP